MVGIAHSRRTAHRCRCGRVIAVRLGPLREPHQRRFEVVGPWKAGVLPSVHHPLAVEYASRIVDPFALHAFEDVEDVLVSSLCEDVDGEGSPPAGAAHDQDRVVRIAQPVTSGMARVPLVATRPFSGSHS